MSNLRGLRYGVFGGVALTEVICPECNSKALVVGGKTNCCDFYIDEIPTQFKIKCSSRIKRRTVKQRERQKAIDRQGGKCIYCEYSFSQMLVRKKGERKIVVVPTIEMDHFVPYSYSYNNQKVNFVASCNICNRIKSNKIFINLEEAREYINSKRDKKGYEPL